MQVGMWYFLGVGASGDITGTLKALGAPALTLSSQRHKEGMQRWERKGPLTGFTKYNFPKDPKGKFELLSWSSYFQS